MARSTGQHRLPPARDARSRFTFMASALVCLGLSLSVLAGCFSTSAGTSGGSVAQTRSTRPTRFNRTVSFRPGQITRSVEVSGVPAPPSHTFTVLFLFPRRARIAAWVRTSSGSTLHLIDTTAIPADCRSVAQSLRCLARFPALEAQPGGRWTLVVTRQPTISAATVHISLRFTSIG